MVACAWHALAPGAPAIPEALVTRGSSDKILARLLAQAALLHSTWLTHVDAVTGASEPRRALQHLLGACRAMDRVTQSGDPLLDGRLGDDDLGIDWEADWGHVAARELADDMRSSQEAWEFPSDCDTCAGLASRGMPAASGTATLTTSAVRAVPLVRLLVARTDIPGNICILALKGSGPTGVWPLPCAG